MSKTSYMLVSLLCLTAVNSLSADSSEIAWGQRPALKKQEECSRGPQHMRISARHIEGKGIGYNQGYTTLEAFLAPNEETWAFMPFLDVRGHLFDNGKWAANAGLGGRWKWGCRAYGINAYYDYRSSKKNYSQVGVGLESLGTVWDFRINGYFPVGSKISHPYHTRFSHFSGHNMFLSRKYEFTMKGVDGELGGHFGPCNWDLFVGAGPYYYDQEIGSSFWGGKARFYAKWKDYVGLQISYSYDNVFKNIVQGEVTFSVPFGARPKVKANRSHCKTGCDSAYTLDVRMVQPIFRDEIMPLNTHKKHKVAINPATGDPYFFVFVNNLSHCLGTFESPFNTLTAAENCSGPNDIIYVFPGDGTTRGMNVGITLQDGQQFLGATQGYTFETTLGTIILPPQASGTAPSITNATGVVVTLANNNTVSGFLMENTNGLAVLGSGIINPTISNNRIQGNTTAGIEFDNVTGTATVSNNVFDFQTQCVFINNTATVSNTTYNITNNQMLQLQGDHTINILFGDGSSNTVNITGNTIPNPNFNQTVTINCTNSQPNLAHTFNITNNEIFASTYPVLVVTNGTTLNFILSNNILQAVNEGVSVALTGSTMTGAMNNNAMNGPYYHISLQLLDTASSFSGTINNNTVIATDGDDDLFIDNHGTLALTLDGNTILGGAYGIAFTNEASALATTLTITNNTISYQSNTGISVTDNGMIPSVFTINNNTCSYQSIYGIVVNASGGATSYEINNNNCSYQSTYGIWVVDLATATAPFTINNNNCSFQGSLGTGMYLTLNTSVPAIMQVNNNTLAQNNGGIFVNNGGSGTSNIEINNNTFAYQVTGLSVSEGRITADVYTINNNSFTGFTTNGVSFFQNVNFPGCLEFNNNISNLFPNAFSITGGGTLNLVTPVGNVGQLTTSGTVPVTSCP